MGELTLSAKFQTKKRNLFVVLSGIFLTNALLAEILGVKIFSAEKTFGFAPAQIQMFGDYILDFNLTAGVIIWPIVFITTDIINEYFGKKGVRKISFLTALFILYSFIIIYAVTRLSPADFWLEVNADKAGRNDFNINEAYSTIFRQGMGIIIGSLTAFLIGQFLDVLVFQKLRKFTGRGKIWLRATGSTLVSQLVDSYVVLLIAFYIFGDWSVEQILSVGSINYLYKGIVAILLTPLLYVAHYFIDGYLGRENAKQIADRAAEKDFF
ncbi:queuosine precursor transporter [Marivirga sp. S37H4]|uniref:Probable queuosine precursor transporter n=1 Tax=Marivirga aurantiaca TaxID=2802615 RepID=A0A935CBQ9_9BACT|nr:queuosine precursor transporter [Marivirga aurantiaca]MBK6266937.1 queuosine precursor transporter [Marivirga aurantiaca]